MNGNFKLINLCIGYVNITMAVSDFEVKKKGNSQAAGASRI